VDEEPYPDVPAVAAEPYPETPGVDEELYPEVPPPYSSSCCLSRLAGSAKGCSCSCCLMKLAGREKGCCSAGAASATTAPGAPEDHVMRRGTSICMCIDRQEEQLSMTPGVPDTSDKSSV
jgi:hypothetical protein